MRALVLVLLVTATRCWQPEITISQGTYLGSSSSGNTEKDVAITHDGTVWVAGGIDEASGSQFNFNLNPITINPTTAHNWNGDAPSSAGGYVVGIKNNVPVKIFRLGKVISHVAAPGNKDSGRIAIAGDFGVLVISTSSGKVLLDAIQKDCTSDCRLAYGKNGKLIVTTPGGSSDTHNVYIDQKLKLENWGKSEMRNVLDVAILGNTFSIVGWRQVSSNLQAACLRTYNIDGTPVEQWKSYCWWYSALKPKNLMADSRGQAIYFNGKYLYFLGSTDGGNNAYTKDPHNLDIKVSIKHFDKYSETTNMGRGKISFVAVLDPNNGDILEGEFYDDRLSSGKSNSLSPVDIAADDNGQIYLALNGACCAQNRDDMRVNGVLTGGYNGADAFLEVIRPDMESRAKWVAFNKKGKASSSAIAVNGNHVAYLSRYAESAITVNPIKGTNPNSKLGKSTNIPYLAVFNAPPLPDLMLQTTSKFGASTVFNNAYKAQKSKVNGKIAYCDGEITKYSSSSGVCLRYYKIGSTINGYAIIPMSNMGLNTDNVQAFAYIASTDVTSGTDCYEYRHDCGHRSGFTGPLWRVPRDSSKTTIALHDFIDDSKSKTLGKYTAVKTTTASFSIASNQVESEVVRQQSSTTLISNKVGMSPTIIVLSGICVVLVVTIIVVAIVWKRTRDQSESQYAEMEMDEEN